MAIRKIVTRSIQDDTILAVDLSAAAFGNTSMPLPAGTTAERPNPPARDGHIRYNTTTLDAEIYKNGTWNPIGSTGYHALKIDNAAGTLVHERYSSADGTVSMSDIENSQSAFFASTSTTFTIDANGNLIVNF